LREAVVAISYRKLKPADARAYREIRLESLKAHPEAFGAGYEEQRKLPKLMFEQAIEEPVGERFVIGAYDGEELIGLCGFVPFVPKDFGELEHTGTIIQMYVRAAYRGKKIGLGLTRAVLAEAFGNPEIEQVVLGVKKGNASAQRVYEQAGFGTYRLVSGEESRDECGRLMIIDEDTFREAAI
jgi:RimJ/RimL family protein N-acetyltransferase